MINLFVMEPQKLLPHLRGAHYVNVMVRKGGRDLEFEADWLKDVIEEWLVFKGLAQQSGLDKGLPG